LKGEGEDIKRGVKRQSVTMECTGLTLIH